METVTKGGPEYLCQHPQALPPIHPACHGKEANTARPAGSLHLPGAPKAKGTQDWASPPYLPLRSLLPFHPRACGPNRMQNLGRGQLWASLPLPAPVFCFSHACLKVDEVVIASGLPSAPCFARFVPGLLMQSWTVQGLSEQRRAGASAVSPTTPLLALSLAELATGFFAINPIELECKPCVIFHFLVALFKNITKK